MKIGKRKWDLNWHTEKVELRHVSHYKGRNNGTDMGYGVFAKTHIKKGEALTIFGGYVIPFSEIKKLTKQLQEYCYQIEDDYFYGPVMHSEISLNERYNHNCDPNCGFSGPIKLVTFRDIKKDEELTMDYATCITNRRFDFDCSCGADHCRKSITGDDWKIKELQKKYEGHFQPYIQEKIKNNKK